MVAALTSRPTPSAAVSTRVLWLPLRHRVGVVVFVTVQLPTLAQESAGTFEAPAQARCAGLGQRFTVAGMSGRSITATLGAPYRATAAGLSRLTRSAPPLVARNSTTSLTL